MFNNNKVKTFLVLSKKDSFPFYVEEYDSLGQNLFKKIYNCETNALNSFYYYQNNLLNDSISEYAEIHEINLTKEILDFTYRYNFPKSDFCDLIIKSEDKIIYDTLRLNSPVAKVEFNAKVLEKGKVLEVYFIPSYYYNKEKPNEGYRSRVVRAYKINHFIDLVNEIINHED